MLAAILIVSLFPGCLPILGKGPFIIVGMFCGIIYNQGGYYSFVIQQIVLALNINSLCSLSVCAHVCLFLVLYL